MQEMKPILLILGLLLCLLSVSAANTLTLTVDSEVNHGDKLGIIAQYANATGDPIANATCTLYTYKNGSIRDLKTYRRPAAVFPEEKSLMTDEAGFCYYMLPIGDNYAIDDTLTLKVVAGTDSNTTNFTVRSAQWANIGGQNLFLNAKDNANGTMFYAAIIAIFLIAGSFVISVVRKK